MKRCILSGLCAVLVGVFSFPAGAGAADRDFDGLLDAPAGPSRSSAPVPQVNGTCALVKTWESPPSPQNLFEVAVGDPDGDGQRSIIVPHYLSPAADLHDFQISGDNLFSKSWSSDPLPYGIYGAVTVSDLDGDGRGEILAGQYNSAVRIFESIGDDSYSERPPLTLAMGGSLIIRALEVADTNGNGAHDVMVVQSNSQFPLQGVMSIYSRDGSRIYGLLTSTYLVDVTSGYFDNDPYLDIFLAHGGFGTEAFYLDWIEFNGSSYSHRTIDLPGTGLPMAATVADTDGDSRNELLVTGIYQGLRQLLVLESDSPDAARIREQIVFPSLTNPQDVAVGHVWATDFPDIAVSTHSSGGPAQVFFFRYDGSHYAPVCHTGSELSASASPFLSIDLAFVDWDGRADVVIGVGSEASRALVLEAQQEVWPTLPDIKANGADGIVRLRRGDPLSIQVNLHAGAATGAPMELWLAALRKSPSRERTFSFRYPGGWAPGLSPAYRGTGADLKPLRVLHTAKLPPGMYSFWFGLDRRPNGQIDSGSLSYDKVRVEIQP